MCVRARVTRGACGYPGPRGQRDVCDARAMPQGARGRLPRCRARDEPGDDARGRGAAGARQHVGALRQHEARPRLRALARAPRHDCKVSHCAGRLCVLLNRGALALCATAAVVPPALQLMPCVLLLLLQLHAVWASHMHVPRRTGPRADRGSRCCGGRRRGLVHRATRRRRAQHRRRPRHAHLTGLRCTTQSPRARTPALSGGPQA